MSKSINSMIAAAALAVGLLAAPTGYAHDERSGSDCPLMHHATMHGGAMTHEMMMSHMGHMGNMMGGHMATPGGPPAPDIAPDVCEFYSSGQSPEDAD